MDYVVKLEPQKRCNVLVTVTEDASKFLASDGGTIYLSKGLCEFTQSDAELQALIAHQLGHFIGGHGTKDASGSIAGGVVDGAATAAVVLPIAIIGSIFSGIAGEPEVGADMMEGSVALIKGGAAAGSSIGSWVATAGHEMEADYMSAYLLARAGVDLDDALLIWNRLPSESDAAKKHHASDARLENIDKAIEEVMAKRNSNEPLIPNPNRRVSESED